jgi:Ulp1 family protease
MTFCFRAGICPAFDGQAINLYTLSSSDEANIDKLLWTNNISSDKILINEFSIPLAMSTFQRLKFGGWLSEDTINFYFVMLNCLRIDGCHCYSTHFMQSVMDKDENMYKRRKFIDFENGEIFFSQ